jgi:hypothetical protein
MPEPKFGLHGRRLWRAVRESWDLDPVETATLTLACHKLDLVERIRVALDAADIVVEGSRGQQRVHPLANGLALQEDQLRLLFGQLKLPPLPESSTADQVLRLVKDADAS